MDPYVHERQMGFPQAADPSRSGADGGPRAHRDPDGVEACSPPEANHYPQVRPESGLRVEPCGPEILRRWRSVPAERLTVDAGQPIEDPARPARKALPGGGVW